MTTRDTMELREDAIKAQYEAALALIVDFHPDRSRFFHREVSHL